MALDNEVEMLRMRLWLMGFIALAGSPALLAASEATLRGSRAAMIHQNRVAKENDFTFLRTPSQVMAYVAGGRLVQLEGDVNYRVEGAAYPFTRLEVKLFVERLGAQHRANCSQKLVVTSATRPSTKQPRNASPLSVHPAGMAVDLRIPETASCRSWLEATLLALEEKGVLDVTREKSPPHYHVAVFTTAYAQYVEALLADSTREAAAEAQRLAAEQAKRDSAIAANVTAASIAPSIKPHGPSRWWLLVGLPLMALVLGLAASIYGPRVRVLAGKKDIPEDTDFTPESPRAAA